MQTQIEADRPRALLRWAGSKRQLLPTIKAYWSDHYKRYLEPFVGSGALFFELAPQRALLGDINAELIHALKEIKRNPEGVSACLRKFKKGRAEYYRLRALNEKSLSPGKRAARFLYLNRFCFNGLYRTNRAGRFNVPYAPRRSGSLAKKSELVSTSKTLGKAKILRGDFEKLLKEAKKGDFIYLDPPYVSTSRRVFSEYDKNAFTTADLPRLNAALDHVVRNGADFVMSYAYTKEARDYFKKWKQRRVRVKRNIAGFIGDRRAAYELLVTNIQERN